MKRAFAAIALLLLAVSSADPRSIHGAATGGGTCTPNGSDGFAGAPAGTAQFPSLLSGYVVRPSWCVPGVDYAVGLASNVSVNTGTDTFTITGTQNNHINGQKVSVRTANGGTLPGGTSLNTAYFVVGASGNTFQISATSGGAAIDLTGSPNLVWVGKIPVAGANSMPPGVTYATGQSHTGLTLESVTPNGASDASNGNQSATGTINIDSYDFSWDTTGAAQHGISISTGGFNGTVNVKNSYFKVGDWLQAAIWQNSAATDIYNLNYNEFDGGGLLQFGTNLRNLKHLIYLSPGGTWTYNYFHHVLPSILASPSSTYTMKFNAVTDMWYGIQSDHADGMFPSVAANISNSEQSYNLFYQPPGVLFANGNRYPGEMDTSMVVFHQPNNSLTLTGIKHNNNTLVAIGNNHMNQTTQTAGPAFAIGWDIEPKVGNTISGMEIKDNYVDSTYIEPGASFGIIKTNGGAGTVTGLTATGNTSLNTGNPITINTSGTQ